MPHSCKGLHCGGCKSGGGAGTVIALVLVAVAAAVIRAVWAALVTVADTIALALEITALVVIGAVGATALGALGYVVLAARQRHIARARAVALEQPGTRWEAEALQSRAAPVPTSARPAIQPKRPRTVPAQNVIRLPVGDWGDGE